MCKPKTVRIVRDEVFGESILQRIITRLTGKTAFRRKIDAAAKQPFVVFRDEID